MINGLKAAAEGLKIMLGLMFFYLLISLLNDLWGIVG